MSYMVIGDGSTYRIVKLVEEFKNHIVVEVVPEGYKKKIKQKDQIYLLNTNDINEFQTQINNLVKEIDVDLLAELIESLEQKIYIDELSALYFGDKVNQASTTALLFAIALDGVTFQNYQDGYFSKCSVEEKQKRQEILLRQDAEKTAYKALVDTLTTAYTTKSDAEFLDVDIVKLLNKPDKNSLVYKALQHVSRELKVLPLELCHQIGLVKDLPKFFVDSFMLENFPKGLSRPKVENEDNTTSTSSKKINNKSLTHNKDIKVFSIDGNATTEIDDAFSVRETQDGYMIGIHIAAPALNPNLADAIAENISTIYYPGNKITMLPESMINEYSLWHKTSAPVVSIYFTLDNEFTILEYSSTVEIVDIADNLRIETLEEEFHTDSLEVEAGYAYEKELKILYQFAGKLEEKRGKPSVNSTVLDYDFAFANDKIIITPRIRGNPIDKLVSELMILANCTWGRMLTNAFIPAIYRVKQPNYPVRMTLTPDSHIGLNVDYYTWATSPLRRAADYINQHQIISLVLGTKEHYTSLDPILLTVVENFDSKYAKYIDFQNKMERYWTLKYLIQEQIDEINATYTYKLNVQLDGVPMNIDLQNLHTAKPRGTQIRLKIYNINLANLTFDFKVIGELPNHE